MAGSKSWSSGQTSEALELLKAAEKIAEKHEDLEQLVEIWGIRVFTLTVKKKFQEAIGEYIKASQVTVDNERLEQWLQWARIRHAYSLLKLSYVSDASTENSKVLTLAKNTGDRFFQSQALNGIGHCLDRVGRTNDALKMYNKALNIADEIHSSNIMSLILNRIGMATAWRKKQLNEAVDFFRRSIAAAQEGGSIWLEFGPMANLAIVKKMKGDFFEASELFEAVKDRSDQAGDLNDQLFAYINLADIYQELGDEVKAKESKYIAQDLARQLRTDLI
jgi:tetratricopeptide (TPR) repeat protein